eukprot:CAMPEP_0177541970 /NCGR_PEP_ID=MMETSP0369-20130122/60517_1 /TAXON_ID=447022 ORGANISM="Scrippsiella hangoei-like, Strain SHHI-4" /NCGR_SAMPLE_ID=MMETSP0369 /ASSEMBLY_ACC=CAM_ASM_000364 /LENGTH=178 /DNA_ID=CAMNT_0019025529 /DNA_START=15 /DNA_END=548 /DNA_ORIENTATION=-
MSERTRCLTGRLAALGLKRQRHQLLRDARHDVLRRPRDVRDDESLVLLQRLQDSQLRRQQTRVHELVAAASQSLTDQLLATREVHEHRGGRPRAEHLAVAALSAEQANTTASPLSSLAPISQAIVSSQGARSSSSSGVPMAIFSLLAFGWKSSPSRNFLPKRSARACPMRDLPAPQAP